MAAKRKTRDPGLRAWRKASSATRSSLRKWQKSVGGEMTRSAKAAMGRGLRRSRIARGVNPNTGKTYSAKQLGLKGTAKKAYRAYSPAAKAGVVKAVGGGNAKQAGRKVRRHYRKSM